MFAKNKRYLIPSITAIILFAVFFLFARFNYGDFTKPKMVIIIRFLEVGPLPDKIPVYYKGIKVGKVVKAGFSDDYKYTYLTVEIDIKDFKPPNNIYAEVKIEDLAQLKVHGVSFKKYLELVYPDKPSSIPLKNGDIIDGKASYLDDIQEILKDAVKKEDLVTSIAGMQGSRGNIQKSSEYLVNISKTINDFLSKNQEKLDEMAENYRQIIENQKIMTENFAFSSGVLREFAEIPAEKKGLRSALNDIPEITSNISGITSGASCIFENPCFQQGMVQTSCGIGNFSQKLDSSFESWELRSLVKNTDSFMRRFDSLGNSLSETLNKKFLLFRFLFGNPAEPFKDSTGPCPKQPGPYVICPQTYQQYSK